MVTLRLATQLCITLEVQLPTLVYKLLEVIGDFYFSICPFLVSLLLLLT